MVNYANIPFSYKIIKFIDNGFIQNEYGFQPPIIFFILSFLYIIKKKDIFQNNVLTYFIIITLLFLISNPITFLIGEKILYLFYFFFPFFEQFRHSGYLYNLTIPFILILTGLYVNYFLKNIEILRIKIKSFSLFILSFLES